MDAGVEVGREVFERVGDGQGVGEGYADGLREMWGWAPGEANRVARGYTWGGGEDEEDGEEEESGSEEGEDGEGEDEVMELDEEGPKDEEKNKGPPPQRILGVEEVMRFMMSGRAPLGAAAAVGGGR